MAIDLGRVRVGVAVADELGLMAHPRPYVDGRDPRRAMKALAELAAREAVEHVLVGLPSTLSGKEGPPARRARRFAAELGQATGLSVELVDERFSSVAALGRLRESGHDPKSARERVDSAAAALMLQGWLDRRRAGG